MIRRTLNTLGRYLDYRTFVALIVLVLTVGVVHSVVSANNRAADAIEARDMDRDEASRRIDALRDELIQVTRSIGDNRRVIAALEAEIAALIEQIRQMGGKPVVAVGRPAPRPTPAPPRDTPSSSTTATPPRPGSPSPTATRTPTRAPTPTPTCIFVPILRRCV